MNNTQELRTLMEDMAECRRLVADLTDHVSQESYLIDWESTTIVGREAGWKRRQIWEAIKIRQEARPLNEDGGNVDLPHLWDVTNSSRAKRYSAATSSDDLATSSEDA